MKTSSFYTTTSWQILKSQVLSLDLKEERELQDLSSNRSAFQTEGAAIVKDRPPWVLRLNLDVESKNWLEDLRSLPCV